MLPVVQFCSVMYQNHEYIPNWIVLSFDAFFVDYRFIFVDYFSDCELPFEPKVIWNQSAKRQPGTVRNRHICPNYLFKHS